MNENFQIRSSYCFKTLSISFLFLGGDKSASSTKLDLLFSISQVQKMSGGSEVIKSDYMLKRSQMRGKFKTENYKNRWFQLTSTVLRYCDGSIESGVGRMKGQIGLNLVTTVENADADGLGNRPNAFQVVYKTGEPNVDETCTLYIIAVYEQQKNDWIDAIRNACSSYGCRFSHKYHPGIWMTRGSKFSCCESINKRSEGCQPVTCPYAKGSATSAMAEIKTVTANNTKAKVPGNHRKSRDVEKEETFGFVFALYDYQSTEETELDIVKGEQYELLEKFETEKWLQVRNKKGTVGLVPGSFVKMTADNEDGLEEFEWFYTKTSRMHSENILQEDGREGCFMVRDSNQIKGVYTLAVLKKSNASDPGTVKHYHIKRSETTGEYYLTDKYQFATIPELVYYHKHNCAGLIVRLRYPPKERMKPNVAVIPDTEEIELSQLKQLGEELGTGQFGKVLKGIYKGTIEVAIKSMKEDTMKEDDFIDEAKTMVKLNHENLVKLYGVCTKKKPILIVTEFMKHGALLHYLKRNKHCLLKETSKLLDFSLQISSAMKYLEEHKIIHRDLAARNCLVGYQDVIKVADFGLARCVIDDEYRSSAGAKFPVKWSSPEVLGYTRFSSKSDVWSFGILMWEIFTCGEMPYGKWKNAEVVENVCNRKYRMPKPSDCPDSIYKVMRSCWGKESEDRPSFSQLNAELQALAEPDDMEN